MYASDTKPDFYPIFYKLFEQLPSYKREHH